MAKKILLSSRNTAWGVEKNQYTGDKYRKTVTFDTWEWKKEFLINELYGGVDFEPLIKNGYEVTYKRISSLKSTFRVSVAEYNKTFGTQLTAQEIAEKDFLMLWDSEKPKNPNAVYFDDPYYYFAVSGNILSNGAIVEFNASSDLFFDNDIRTMFKSDKQVQIEQAHIDRVYKDENGNFKADFRDNSKLLFDEPIDASLGENTKIMDKIEHITSGQGYENGYILLHINMPLFLKAGTKNFTLKDKTYTINFGGANFGGGALFQTLGDNDLSLFITYQLLGDDIVDWITPNIFPIEIGGVSYTNVMLLPLYNEKTKMDELTYYNLLNNLIMFFQYHEAVTSIRRVNIPKEVLNAYISKNSVRVCPIIYLHGGTFIGSENTDLNDENWYFNILSLDSSFNEKLDFTIDRFKDWEFKTNINDNFIIENETKLQKSVYSPTYLTDYENNKFNIFYEYANGALKIDYFKSFNPFFDSVVLLPFNETSSIYKKSFDYGLKFTSSFDNSILRKSNAYSTFMLENSSQFQLNQRIAKRDASLSFADSIVKLVGGIGGGIVAGGMGINKIAGIAGGIVGGGLGGLSGIMKSHDEIHRLASQKQDMLNTPDKIVGNANDEMLISTSKNDIIPFVVHQKLYDDLFYKIGQHFNVYGHNCNSIFDNINDYLNTRYHFNYIKASGLFETFALELSSEKRQLIANSIENGIHIFHYRGAETWRGISNFNVNNVEFKYATTE